MAIITGNQAKKQDLPCLGTEIAGSIFRGLGTPRQRARRPIGEMRTFWLMQCGICGTRFESDAAEIRHIAKKGKTRFCGNAHLHTGINIGDRFNRTVVVEWIAPKNSKDNRWQCRLQCDCGNVHMGRPDQLKRGMIQSCGCRKSEVTSRLKTTHGLSGSAQYRMFTQAKLRAQKEGFPFNIELDDCAIPETCPVLGIPLDLGIKKDGQRQDNSPSLDKFIPEKGYVKGNVAVISWLANRIKTNANASDVMKVAVWMQQNEHS